MRWLIWREEHLVSSHMLYTWVQSQSDSSGLRVRVGLEEDTDAYKVPQQASVCYICLKDHNKIIQSYHHLPRHNQHYLNLYKLSTVRDIIQTAPRVEKWCILKACSTIGKQDGKQEQPSCTTNHPPFKKDRKQNLPHNKCSKFYRFNKPQKPEKSFSFVIMINNMVLWS